MAQDLSQTIQDGLAQTLTDLLGVDTKLQEVTKADKRDLQTFQHLEVISEFEFDKLSSPIKFIIPATTASIIFNTMMGGSDYDIAEVVDDDTTDAMGEFVSNVSGSLVTAFNAKDIQDLGKAKFHIQHKEVIDGSAIESIENIFRFLIELDEKPITIFIQFNDQFLPFIEEITNAEPTFYPEETSQPQEEDPIEELEQDTNIEPEEVILSTPKPSSNEMQQENKETTDPEIKDDPIEDEEKQKKAKKMKLIIIILSSLITLVIIIFLAIYLMSSPEDEESKQPTQEANKSKPQEKEEIKEVKTETTKTLKKIDFDIKDIDIGRLNGRLATLTKYEILTKEELQAQKLEEVKRLERLKKEEELKEFAKRNKEEPVELPPVPKTKTSQPTVQNRPTLQQKQEQTTTPKEEQTLVKTPQVTSEKKNLQQDQANLKESALKTPEQLLFVLTNSIKYTLFKSLVSQLNSNSARISMCNDKEGRTTILIGPFEDKKTQGRMDQLIKDSKEDIATTLTSLTQEQFNQRCDF